MKGKYAHYKYVSCVSVNAQKQPSEDVLQKRYSAKRQQIYRISRCRSVISIKLGSKNSSINLYFWKCRLVWLVLKLKS